MRFILPLLALGSLFAATSPEPPKLRLPDGVQPSRYAVDLTLIPGQDAFHGVVDISIDIRTPTSILWLNAAALKIQDASFRAASGSIARAQVVAGGADFAGFSFDHPISGKGVLHAA